MIAHCHYNTNTIIIKIKQYVKMSGQKGRKFIFSGVFFFVAFSFAAAMAKEKADRTHIVFMTGRVEYYIRLELDV